MIVLPLAVLCLRRRKPADFGLSFRTGRRDLLWGLLLFTAIALPTAVAYVCGWVVLKPPSQRLPIVDTIIFQLVFSAFGEELLFRGYFQTRLNDSLGRRWKIGAIRFGPSLIVVAGIFGLAHLLNPFNPLSGHFRLDWTALLITSVVGLHLGLLREATGTLIAPTLVHFADVWMDCFRETSTFSLAVGVGWALAWFLLFMIPRAGQTATAGPDQAMTADE